MAANGLAAQQVGTIEKRSACLRIATGVGQPARRREAGGQEVGTTSVLQLPGSTRPGHQADRQRDAERH